ncbi:MAG: TMEM14 family protein [Fimbriimonas sp.]
MNVALLIYAILSIALGAYGFIAKGSVPSVIAGSVAGLLILGTVALAKTNPRVARIAAAVITLLVLGQMGPKALEDKTWHTVTMSVASLIVLAILVAGHFSAMAKRKAGEPE